jgi:hypothetical protein
MSEEKKWFGVEGVGQLLRLQRPPTTVTRTMAAAYRQHADIGQLLELLEGVKLGKEGRAILADITKRHETYRTQM